MKNTGLAVTDREMNMRETEAQLPKVVANEADLEELLSRPSPALVNMMKRLDGDIVVLGVVTGQVKTGHWWAG